MRGQKPAWVIEKCSKGTYILTPAICIPYEDAWEFKAACNKAKKNMGQARELCWCKQKKNFSFFPPTL